MIRMMLSVLAAVVIFAPLSFAKDTSEGKSLYQGDKYHCFSCHGRMGEGGQGPSFKGIGKKFNDSELMKHAAHRCPPTGACNPKELEAIVSYIRTM